MPKRNKPDTLEYKSISFELKDFGDDDTDDRWFYFKGYGSTFGNVDLGDDVVERGAFTDTLKKRRPVLLWQHDMREPIGVPVVLKEDAIGLYIEGRLPKEDHLVMGRVIPQMKIGAITSMSIGYSVDEFSIKNGIRHIEKATLYEISLVTFPMNPQAVVTGMKSVTPFKDLPLAERDMAWDSSAAIARVRAFTESEDAPSASYKNAFFWYDREMGDEFGGYKLPFADVVDGRLVAVPRGIFAAAAAMQGARGGVDIPTGDRISVERHINRYYAKMELESPFEKRGLGAAEIETMTAKEIEHYLRDAGIFSKSLCKKVAIQLADGRCEADDSERCEAGKSCNPFLEELRLLKTNFN